MSVTERAYSGTALRDRVDARRERLLAAAYETMTRGGWQAASISQLCRDAALNKRYFYESFEDLDQVAGAVFDTLSARLIQVGFTAVAAARQEGLGPPDLARKAMRVTVGHLLEDPRRVRVLFSEIASSPAAEAGRRVAMDQVARALAHYAHIHYDAGEETDPVASVTATLLIGGTTQTLLRYVDGELPMSEEQLADDLAHLWRACGDAANALARSRREAGKA